MEEELTGEGVDLPTEIMHDILSRLPVKPLCRFKLVSKTWLSLISNTNFITMHSKAVETNQSLLFQRRRVFFSDPENTRYYSLDLDRFHDEVDAPVITRFRFHQRSRSRTLSCNGLLLTKSPSWSNSNHYLVNPLAMMKPKQLPIPPASFKPIPFAFPRKYFGLGFDISTNEHKVVHLESSFFDYEFAFSVYNAETDSWREATRRSFFPEKPRIIGSEGVLVNGGVHWLIRDDRKKLFGKDVLWIIGFMITEEKIVTIRLPRLLVKLKHPDIELGGFRDGLCITFKSSSHMLKPKWYDEFWVMKEYGVRESWTKMRISIPYTGLSHSGYWRGSYDLMKIKTDGYKSSLVMYNFDADEYWTLKIKHKGRDFRYGDVGVYVESLASGRFSYYLLTTEPQEEDKIFVEEIAQVPRKSLVSEQNFKDILKTGSSI